MYGRIYRRVDLCCHKSVFNDNINAGADIKIDTVLVTTIVFIQWQKAIFHIGCKREKVGRKEETIIKSIDTINIRKDRKYCSQKVDKYKKSCGV